MALPEWLEPMKATLTRERFEGPEWVFERKLDGIRLLAYKQGTKVRLLTRNKLVRNDHYPVIAEAVAKLPQREVILDGEAVGMFGLRGVPDGYHVFDVLWLDGKSVADRPLHERRELLTALELEPPLYLVDRLDERRPWERACREGWEGVVAKRADSPYEHKRSKHWLKMKCEAGQELVIGGFTEFIKADREGRILIDTGRNGPGATFAAAYALRPRQGASRRRARGPSSRAAQRRLKRFACERWQSA